MSAASKSVGKKKDAGAGRRVRVRQVRGLSGREVTTRRTIEALGLGRVGKSRVFQVNPALSGMIMSVSHLVEVEPVE
jgi:large subunit ribosomal protein L30